MANEHPFEVFYDEESEKYMMFLPDGSVMVDGLPCKCKNRDDGDLNVRLVIDPESPPEMIYGHVDVDLSADPEDDTFGKVEFDGENKPEGREEEPNHLYFDFPVCRFGKNENDGFQYDVLTSSINFGTGRGSGVRGIFEPVFSVVTSDGGKKEHVLDSVGKGMFSYGRSFYAVNNPKVNDSAKVIRGLIGIRIIHRGDGRQYPSSEIVLASDGLTNVNNTFSSEGVVSTVIPLYYINDGKIDIDCRCLMSLAIRE